MDATLSPLPAQPLSLALPAPSPKAASPTAPPWEAEALAVPQPARRAPGKPARPKSPRIQSEKLPWGMIALTIATAVLVIFGARAADDRGSRVMPLTKVQSAG
jgi:hypothetical protein